jgi:mRNA interferase HicA
MARLPRVTASELIRVLEKRGFVFTRERGSHRIYFHAETHRRVTVAFHRGRVIPPGTLLNILKEAGIERDELVDLLRG